MNLLIEIETKDEILGSELLETPKKVDRMKNLPASAVLMKVHQNMTREGILTFLLSFRPGVDADLIANWLYERIKGRANELRLDRAEVQINKEEIEKFIIEKMGKRIEDNPIRFKSKYI